MISWSNKLILSKKLKKRDLAKIKDGISNGRLVRNVTV